MLELELFLFYLTSFEESPESYLSRSRGALREYPVGGMIYGACGVCTRCMRCYGSVWCELLVSVSLGALYCALVQDDTPVCHYCLVVNGTSAFIINIPSRHGC